MKYLFLLLIFCAASFSKVVAQKHTVISGNIYTNNKDVNITLYRAINVLNESDTVLPVIDNHFSYSFDIKEPAYFNLSDESTDLNFMLLEPGDSLAITVDSSGKLQWSGRGFEKNIYQIESQTKFKNQLNYSDNSILLKDDNLYFKFLDSCKSLQLSFLNTFENRLSRVAYNILKADIIGEIDNNKAMRIMRRSFDTQKQNYAKQLYINWMLNNVSNLSENDTLSYSLFYMNYRYQKNELDYFMLYNLNNAEWNINNKYYIVKSLSNGLVREKLLARILLNEIHTEITDGVKEHLNDYLHSTAKDEFKNFIKSEYSFQEKFGFGRPGINFSLPDINSKLTTLNQFKGKVVIIDFWYKGCPGCASLFNAMQKVKDNFRKDSNVVFINISIDLRKDDWLKGIEQFKLDKDINLYTEGYGENHHTVKDYGIQGYPKQFIIDKQGKFISSNPPRADNDNGEGITNMIQNALK